MYKCCKSAVWKTNHLTDFFFSFLFFRCLQIEPAPALNLERKVGRDNTNPIYEPANIPEEQPVIPQGAARPEQPPVPLISSFIPRRHPLTGDDRAVWQRQIDHLIRLNLWIDGSWLKRNTPTGILDESIETTTCRGEEPMLSHLKDSVCINVSHSMCCLWGRKCLLLLRTGKSCYHDASLCFPFTSSACLCGLPVIWDRLLHGEWHTI